MVRKDISLRQVYRCAAVGMDANVSVGLASAVLMAPLSNSIPSHPPKTLSLFHGQFTGSLEDFPTPSGTASLSQCSSSGTLINSQFMGQIYLFDGRMGINKKSCLSLLRESHVPLCSLFFKCGKHTQHKTYYHNLFLVVRVLVKFIRKEI
jgi:hypothetical protein